MQHLHVGRRNLFKIINPKLPNFILTARYNGEKLAAPGDAKHLIDIGEEDLLENSDKEFAQLLADR